MDADKLATNLRELGAALQVPCLKLYADQVAQLGRELDAARAGRTHWPAP